jgi:hypothetical protein
MLDFYEKPPYKHFITLLEKEKENLIINNLSSQYKFIWTNKIKEALFINNKRDNEIKKQIKNLFYNININDLKKYFNTFKKQP